MKILVAGGAGYIGSVLVPQLIDHGYEVDVIDLLWFGNHLPDGVQVIPKDLMYIKGSDLCGYDQVIFIAGLSNDPMAEYSPSQNFIYNMALPAYLSYISKQAGVKRFIYGCSCSVYGHSVNKPCDESSLTAPTFPYGIAKLQAENTCLSLQSENFSVISLRKGTICGYSPRMRLDLIINTMFKTAIVEEMININNPSTWRPIIDVRDAALAYIRAIEADYRVSGIFNIAYGNFTVAEVADCVKEAVKKHLGINTRLITKNIEDIRNYKVSIEKASNILNFHPNYNIEDIVKNLVAEMGNFEDLENPNYYNIEVFKRISNEHSLIGVR